MSNNSMLSNNGMSQPVLSSQQQLSGHRARAISACSASGIPIAPAYQQNYSQSYQTFPPIHASWTQTQQGMYMNVYPGTSISEVEDINLNQSGDSYKYQQGVKLSGVPSQLTNQGYHPSGGLSGGTHGTLQPMSAQVPFAMAAAPNGLSQAPTSLPNTVTSLRNDPTNLLHSTTPHSATPGQSLFVHGFVGQQNVPSQLGQNTLSPSFVTESPAAGPNMQLGSFSTKDNTQLNGSHNPRTLQPTPLSGVHTPATHPSYATALPIHQTQTVTPHPSFYPNSTMQQPPPPATHLTPHGMVEFLPAMISTDPNAAQNQFNTASFGQYATHYPSAYDPSSVDTSYNARVRHNTWAGLETNAPNANQGQNRVMDPKSFENVYDMTGTLGHNSNNTRLSLATDRMAATLSQRGSNEVHNQLNSNAYNGNSAAQIGSQLPELLEFYSSLPVPDHWLSLCNRYSNSTLPLTSNTRNTKAEERGFEPRVSHWNQLPPHTPLATQWSQKPATSMLPSSYKTNTGMHGQNPQMAIDVQNQRRMVDGLGRGHNSFPKRTNDQSQHYKTASTPRAPQDSSGANRAKNTRTNPLLQSGRTVPYAERIGSWRPGNGTGGLDGGKPVGHFNPTSDVTSNPIPTGLEWNWVAPSGLVDQNMMRVGQSSSHQPSGIRNRDPFLWPTQLVNPFLSAVVPGAIDSANRHRSKLMPPTRQTLPFVDATNTLANHRLVDPANSAARFNHGLRLLRDVFPTRILVSTALVGAVIGRGGRTIRLITAKTGAQIDFKPQTVLFSQFSLPGGTASGTRSHAAATTTSVEKQVTEGETKDSSKKNVTDGVKDTASTDSMSPSQKAKPQPNAATQQQESSPPLDSEGHPPRPAQLNRSQPVYLFGTREQCSAAVGEILAVCYRECMHGPSAPCLGLLVSHQVYQQLLMGCGRRYFGLLHATTGARVSVTGSPAHLEPIETKQSDRDQSMKKSTIKPESDAPDRIIVVRGDLGAICAAEACISEQVRLIMARDSVPACMWPLIPHLPPLVSSPRSHSSSLAAATPATRSSTSPAFDLATLNRLTLCVALMFWNPTTWNKLISYVVPSTSTAVRAADPPLPQSVAITSGNRAARSADRIPSGAVRRSSDPFVRGSPVHSDITESTLDHASLPPPETRSAIVETVDEMQMEEIEKDGGKDVLKADTLSTLAPLDQDEPAGLSLPTPADSAKQAISTETKDSFNLDSNLLSEKRRPGSAPVSPVGRPSRSPHPAPTVPWSTLFNMDLANSPLGMCKPSQNSIAALFQHTAKDRELLASLQQAIVTAIGPAAWLSTSGLLYMRVSYQEAGALIGTRGCRIRQIMEATGAKIHVGKTRISEPYALSRPSRRDQRAKSSSKPRSESSLDPATATSHGDNDNIKISSDTGDSEPTHGIAEPLSESVDHTSSLVLRDRDTLEVDPDESMTTSSPSAKPSKIPSESTKTNLSPVRLRNKLETEEDDDGNPDHTLPVNSSCVVPCNDHTTIDTQKSAVAQTGYRLVTLSGPLQSQLMAHWRIFQCLKSLHSRENKPDSMDEDSRIKVTSQSDTSHAQSHSLDLLRLATLVCVPYAFGSWLTVPNTTFEHPDTPDKQRSNPSALSWLQAEARRRMQGRFSDAAQVKAICALRKPKPRILARLRRGPPLSAGTSVAGQPSAASPPVDDVVTALWSDRSRAPIEIYADYETTQFLLGCLHHMHAIWLYGETVVQRTAAVSNQSALLSTPPSRRQQSLVYPGARLPYPAGGLRQALPPDNELGGPAAAAVGRGSQFDWSPLWCPWWPTDPLGRFIGNPNIPVQLPHPDGYGRFPRVRHPTHATNRWQQPPGRPDRARFPNDPASLLAAMMMMTTTTQRASPLAPSSSFAPSLFAQFPVTANGTRLTGSTSHSSAGPAPLLFNPFPLTPSLQRGPPKSFPRNEIGTWNGGLGRVTGKPNCPVAHRPELQIHIRSRQPPADCSLSQNVESTSAKLNATDPAEPTSPGNEIDTTD